MTITDLSALELSATIQRREVSCREVMQAYLQNIAKFNGQINAIILQRDEDALLKEANAADLALKQGKSYGWMHGMPQAIKDLAQTKGIKTTRGSPIFANDAVAVVDDTHVERVKNAGAIIVGKTNTPEFGLGSHTYNVVHGATRNPYNLDKSAGGSSGGAAAALASHMLPVADGSDMMGSLRNPASFCNIVGLRPSFGRVASGPNISFGNFLGVSGPMGRNVADTARLLQTQAGISDYDPYSRPFPQKSLLDFYQKKKPIIGFLGDYNGYLPLETGVMDIMQQALAVMTDMGAIVENTLPDYDLDKLWQGWVNLRSWHVSSIAAGLYYDENKKALLKPEAVWEIEKGLSLSGQDITHAMNVRNGWLNSLLKLFQHVDYLVLPTAQVFPFDVERPWVADIAGKKMDTYHRWMEVVITASMVGLPAISIPAGFSDTGLPAGVQIIGKPHGDWDLLQFAQAFETARGIIQRPLDPRLS